MLFSLKEIFRYKCGEYENYTYDANIKNICVTFYHTAESSPPLVWIYASRSYKGASPPYYNFYTSGV